MRVEFVCAEKILAISDNYLFTYKTGVLYVRDKVTKKLVRKKRIHNRLKSFTIIERLMRFEPRIGCALSDTLLLYTDHGAIFKYDVCKNRVELEHSFSRGMNNPLYFCVRRDQSRQITELLYGEYIWNEGKGPVSIFKYDMKEWKEVYSFPPNSITHIHNIQYDNEKDRYLITTGDNDSESAIWEADSDFKNIRAIAGGSQNYRSCFIFITKDGNYYPTDTPLERNKLYFMDQKADIHEVYEMPGPCIYGITHQGNLYLATSVEGDPKIGNIRYRVSNKLGMGVKDRYVHIIRCDKFGKVTELLKYKKDWLPMWLFQFGNAQFVDAEDGLYFSLQSTIKRGTYKIIEE